MPKLIWLLRLFTKGWIAIVAVMFALGGLATLIRHGWTEFEERFVSFNFWTMLQLYLFFAPAHFAEVLARKLEAKLPLTPESAEKLLSEYKSALERRSLELPASKERIKAAFRLLAQEVVHDEARLFQLGAGYVALSDFQEQATTSEEARDAETIALCAEWKSWVEQLWSSFGAPGEEFAEAHPQLAAQVSSLPWYPEKNRLSPGVVQKGTSTG